MEEKKKERDAQLAICVAAAAGQSIDSAIADALHYVARGVPNRCTRLLFNGRYIGVNSDDTQETVLKRWSEMITAEEPPIMDKLERFLAEFPDNATSWAQATDELPDLYRWISKDGERFPSVGRDNCHTPAEWNQKYKAAIRSGFSKLDEKTQTEMFHVFAEWFEK